MDISNWPNYHDGPHVTSSLAESLILLFYFQPVITVETDTRLDRLDTVMPRISDSANLANVHIFRQFTVHFGASAGTARTPVPVSLWIAPKVFVLTKVIEVSLAGYYRPSEIYPHIVCAIAHSFSLPLIGNRKAQAWLPGRIRCQCFCMLYRGKSLGNLPAHDKQQPKICHLWRQHLDTSRT
jgi:hypothetical protein